MRNLRRTNVSIDKGLELAKKNLHDPKKSFLTKYGTLLKGVYQNYDNNALSGNLHTLHPLWADNPGDSPIVKKEKENNRTLAYDLYGSKRPIINDHWDKLRQLNGNTTIMCPICELNEATEMDHYVPRDEMPEYSVHLSNLIPLCHDCNHTKSTLWLTKSGQRIFFNAYFDAVIPTPIIQCAIKIKKGNPTVKVSESSSAASDAIIHETIKRLELLKKYQREANALLKRETIRIKETYMLNTSIPKADFWSNYKPIYLSYIRSHRQAWNIVEVSLWESIYNSIDMENWVINDM